MERPVRLVATALLTFSLASLSSHGSLSASFSEHLAGVPRLILWAWERPEDMRFIDPDRVGVAFLAGTALIADRGLDFRPRLQPLRVSPQARLIAVVRVETTPNAPLNALQAEKTAAAIQRAAAQPHVVAVQIDFDATQSQHAFYRDMLAQLRAQLPASTPISVTALASWCLGDDWLSGLPIDEAVPMLFRMGTGTNEVRNRIKAGRDFRQPACRDSLGISTDEPWKALPSRRRVYVFSPSPWNARSLQALRWEMHAWQ